jgi:hypothetical protein
MIPQIEQLQRILNKILPERYLEIKNINVFEHKIAKLVSIPLSNVLVLPEFMIYKN